MHFLDNNTKVSHFLATVQVIAETWDPEKDVDCSYMKKSSIRHRLGKPNTDTLTPGLLDGLSGTTGLAGTLFDADRLPD